eukprot:476008_1
MAMLSKNVLSKVHKSHCNILYISKYHNHQNEKLEILTHSMQQFTDLHEDIANNFESVQEKFRMSMEVFNANLFLYPSYANKFSKTFENLSISSNNLYDSTHDVISSINDENITTHAMEETLNKIKSDTQKLYKLNECIELFYDISILLDEGTKQINNISKQYEVYSELNYHLYPNKINEINNMKPIFPNIEDLKCLKGPMIGHTNENEIICISYDGINSPEISPIWFKYDKIKNNWEWSCFDPFSNEFDMFGHEWISVLNTAIEGEFGGEIAQHRHKHNKNIGQTVAYSTNFRDENYNNYEVLEYESYTI